MDVTATGSLRKLSSDRPSEVSSRRTNGRACISCRQRKVRCDVSDHGTPCSNCQSRNRSDCHIYEAKKRRARAAASTNGLSKPTKTNPGIAISYQNILPSPHQVVSTAAYRQTSSTPSDLLNSDPLRDGDEVKDQGNIAEFLDREDIRSSDIDNATRNCYVGTEQSNFNYLIHQSSVQKLNPGCFHFANRQFHPSLTSYNLERMPPEALERPKQALADKLIYAYFDEINCGWPLIDEEDFMVKYKGNDPYNPMPLQLLNAVFLMGARVLAAQDNTMKAYQAHFFRRAKILMDFRFEQDRVSYVQAALLLSWYSDGQEEIMANAWHWIGMACRIALGMGMHRDTSPSRLQDISKRTWTRLWWILFQFDTITSCAYGRPQALNLDESDVPELKLSHFKGVLKAEVDFVIQHTHLCIVISRAMRGRWALRSSIASQVEATRQADEALGQFLAQLPPKLRATPSEINIWQATLHLTYNNALILLHRPPPKQASHVLTVTLVSDATICSDAALAMTSVFETLVSQGSVHKLWLNGTFALFTAIVHVTSTLNSSNALVATKSFRMFDILLTTLRALSYHWQFALSLLSLFEKRLQRAKKLTTMEDTAQDPHVYEPLEACAEPVHRQAHVRAGNSTKESAGFNTGYDGDLSGDMGMFPPLDDILLNGFFSLEESTLDDFLESFKL